MEIEAKPILYNVIEKMGRKRIESEIVSTPSSIPKIIREIFSTCVTELRPHEYDKARVHSDLVLALMHYLLTVCLIQAERKVEYSGGIILDIVIPSARQLKVDPRRTLLLVFPKGIDPEAINVDATSVQKVQPDKENIWLVFGHFNHEMITACKDFRRYVPDDLARESLKPLSSIIDDIKSFLEVNKIKSFKIFPT